MPAKSSSTAGRGIRSLVDLWTLLKRAAVRWNEDNAMRLAAAVAMYTFLSLGPLLLIAIKVTSLVLSDEAATQLVGAQAESYLGPKGAKAVRDMLTGENRTDSGLWATLLSFGLLLFTASGVFAELRDSLNSIWRVGPAQGRGWFAAVRERLTSIGMVMVCGFLLLASQVLTTVLTAVARTVANGAGRQSAVVIDLVASTAVISVLFAMVFRLLPDVRPSWRQVSVGSVVTAILFKLGQYLQALYFTYISTGSLYGAAGSFAVLLLWVYYSCWILFYGAELIEVRAEMRGERFAKAE